MRAHFASSAFIAAALLLGLSACATSRSVIGIDLPPDPPKATGTPIKIAAVTDLRQFSVDPDNPSLPSLGDAAEIIDPKITAQAMGRKRNSYGKALGDLMLPPGQTVTGVVEAATRQALEASGYRVVDSNSPDYARATTIAIKVDQFWAWGQPGFAALTLNFDAKVSLDGTVANANLSEPITIHAETHPQMGTEDNWKEVIQIGIKKLIDAMKDRLKPAALTRSPTVS